MELKTINDRVSVSGQIQPSDLDAIKEAGFVMVVNNRPDGEAPDQPTGAEIKSRAEALGLTYVEIPMGREGVTPDMIEATRNALDSAAGKVLCYCRTGTRSTTLWALSQSGALPAEEILSSASKAGYDMNHLSAYLRS
ncbi:TIGR01244 family sulfur transferase [Cucumibacter marinus]|uniref:TIGR01244 family sulfur transferase n=1 Tax=Cucumibacter marinus TaxID=1121252 RepID=UPI000416645E|nr:TIGR01244 family sulfur transferase [Cucumibacter marinus]